MALGKRAYLHLFNVVLFGAFTLLTVLRDLRLTPGFAALAIAQALLAILVLQRPGAQRSALVLRGDARKEGLMGEPGGSPTPTPRVGLEPTTLRLTAGCSAN